MLLNEHGFNVGAVADTMTLPCSDGRERVIGHRTAVQLITFSSPGDCSACQTHLAGLATIHHEHALGLEHLYVAFPAGIPVESARSFYDSVTERPVCWDERGDLWDALDIAHTPVTVLLRQGTVVLMHDAPLTSASSRRLLLDSIGKFLIPSH